MGSDEKRPHTIDDLADEALEGFDKLLNPETYEFVHSLLGQLYTSHPVMSRLANEALVDVRPETVASDEQIKPGVELPPEQLLKRKLDEK